MIFLKSKVNDVISLTVILKIMYLKPVKNFTYSVVFQNRASSSPSRKQSDEVL